MILIYLFKEQQRWKEFFVVISTDPQRKKDSQQF